MLKYFNEYDRRNFHGQRGGVYVRNISIPSNKFRFELFMISIYKVKTAPTKQNSYKH